MGDDRPYSRRLVLRSGGEAVVDQLAAGLGWPRRSESEGDQDAWRPRQVDWYAGPGIALHYLEDLLTDLTYVLVSGDDPDIVRVTTELVEAQLPVWTVDELVDDARAQQDSEDLSYSLVRLGLGAPRACTQAVLSIIVSGMSHASKDVREAAVWATSYQPWPEYVPPLQQLLAREPDADLAQTIRNLLDEFTEALA